MAKRRVGNSKTHDSLITSGAVFIGLMILVGLVAGSGWVIGATLKTVDHGTDGNVSVDRAACIMLYDEMQALSNEPGNGLGRGMSAVRFERPVHVAGRQYRLSKFEAGGVRCQALSSRENLMMDWTATGELTVKLSR